MTTFFFQPLGPAQKVPAKTLAEYAELLRADVASLKTDTFAATRSGTVYSVAGATGATNHVVYALTEGTVEVQGPAVVVLGG